MSEILACYAWIRQCLLGAEAPSSDQQALISLIGQRVYAGSAPSKDATTKKAPTYPMIVLANVTSRNVIFAEGTTGWINATIDVRIVGNTSLGDLAAIDSLVVKLLQQTSGDIGGCHIMGCYQEAVIIAPPIQDGDTIYQQIVQTYRIRAYRQPDS